MVNVMAKIKVPARPADCKTAAEQVAYSMRLRQIYDEEVCAWDAPPSALDEYQTKYPFDPRYPWTCPSFAASYSRAQEEKERALRAIEGGATYLCSYLLDLDGDTHLALCREAAAKERTTLALLRRYSIAAFKFFLADEDGDEALKAA